MDDYLSKPIRGAELRAVLEKLATPPTMVPSASEPAVLGPGTLDGISAMRQSGQQDLAQQVSDLYRIRLPESIAAIGRAVTAGDATALRDEAHGLKGSSLMLGATSIAELCGELEQLGKDRRFGESETILKRLEAVADSYLQDHA